MGFTGEILSQAGDFILQLFPIFSNFIDSIVQEVGNATISVIQSSISSQGILGPSLFALTIGATFVVAMGAFAFVRGVADMTGGA